MRFSPADVLTSFSSSLLLLTGGLFWMAPGVPAASGKILAAFLIPLAAAFLRVRWPQARALQVVCDFSPMVSLIVIFDNLGPFIQAVHPIDRDAWLIALDRLLLGTDPTRWLEPFANPVLSDVLTVCYSLYFFHPLILGGVLYAHDAARVRAGAPREFPRYAFTVLASFYISYAGYFLVPAIGPRFTITHEGPLPRGAVSAVIDKTLDTLETNKRNCFPSGHTLVVLVVLIEAFRRARKIFWILLPLAVGLILATVYGRYHYVTDVLAAFVLTWPVYALAQALGAKLDQRLEGTGRESSR